VAGALLDAYEQLGDPRLLQTAASAADYIVNELYWTDGDVASLSYPLASSRSRIHNANLLGGALLCRIARLTADRRWLEPALNAARYSARQQRPDGSWPYGELPGQGWIDNFHTGYNLMGLRRIDLYTGSTEFESHTRAGFEFYRRHFVREDGAARYFHDNTFPIDIHCVAQSLITLTEFAHLDGDATKLAERVFDWAMEHMWDSRGFFYYRQLRLCTIRISYMRWSQAWMLAGLASLAGQMHVRVEAAPHVHRRG
jgi:rhamnogalacturonyl hydrolase YesR